MGTPSAPSGGRRWLRRIALAVGGLVTLLCVAALGVYLASERRIHRRFEVAGEALAIPTAPEALARGEHLARTRGCFDCHGEHGQGQVFLRAMPVMELHPSNLTTGGPTARWSGQDWTRAVRHCVRPDGSGVPFMPCSDYRFLDDRDLGEIIAYIRTLPASNNDPGPSVIGPVGRVLLLKGDLPYIPAEAIDHRAAVPAAPPEGPTAAYGRYLAAGCTGCHGEGFSGGRIPGTPPEWPAAPNITPDPNTGIGSMTQEQFDAAITQGRGRNGRALNATYMPWRMFARFTPQERAALWLFLRSVPARPAGNR